MAAYLCAGRARLAALDARREACRCASWPLLFAAACTTIKTPGIVWALTLVPGIVVALLPRRGPQVVAAALAAALLALAVLAQTHPMVLGYRLHLDFAPAWQALVDSLFLLGNWNLLWYGAIAAALARLAHSANACVRRTVHDRSWPPACCSSSSRSRSPTRATG